MTSSQRKLETPAHTVTIKLSRSARFFFSSRRRHTRLVSDWSSDVCSSDLRPAYENQPARAGYVDADSPAAKAGVQVGDLIVRFDGLQNPKWADLGDKVLISVGESVPVDVERDGRLLHLTLTPRAEGPDSLGYAGFHPIMPGVVGTVERGFPASMAGLQPGDEIVGLNSKP